MTATLCCFICEHYQTELETVLQEDEFADVHYTVFPARCGHPPLTRNELTTYETVLSVPCQSLYVIGGRCLQSIISSSKQQSRVVCEFRDNCFELFVNAPIIEQFIREGKYLLTPGWLARWRQHIKEWGFDQPTARAFFAEWATQLLLLDTGIDANASAYLQALSEFLQLPNAVLPVGLDVFRLSVEHAIRTWRTEQQQQKITAELSDASKKLADYAMLSHIFHQIATTTSEDEVIRRIIELFTMLCAPQQVLYLPIVQGKPGTLHGNFQDSRKIPDDLLDIVELQTPYAWTASHAGFYLRISHQAETVGVMKIETFTFPHYKEHYLNLAQNIATLCGLAVSNARRYQRLEIVNEELRKAKDLADSANQAKSLFLSNMSHEFRTPLNGILGYTQLLLKDPTLGERQCEQIEILQRSGEHLLSLITDILDFAKIEAHHIELEPVQFRFANFLRDLTEMIRARASYKELRVVADVPWSELPVMVFADEKRLRQVLLNLLGNAIKFTEQGSVTLKVKKLETGNWKLEGSTPPTTRRSLSEIEDSVSSIQHPVSDFRFQVSDTGIGIEPDQLDSIFSPFEQAHHARYYAEGTGLGLAISREFVRLMDSELYVKSQPGQGSTFWFDLTLPEVSEKQLSNLPNTKGHARIVGIKGKSPVVLIADDRFENRRLMKDMLAPLGFTVLEADNGREAVDIVRMRHPDAVLLDTMMPELDGLEVIGRIRQHSDLQDVTIIVVSASGSLTERDKAREAGCHEFLIKPINVQALLDSLQQHIEFEWLYEDFLSVQESSVEQNDQFCLPPHHLLSQLYELAVIGDIFSIRYLLDEIEQTDPHCAAFVDKIRKLAKDFQIAKIQEVVHAHLSADEGH